MSLETACAPAPTVSVVPAAPQHSAVVGERLLQSSHEHKIFSSRPEARRPLTEHRFGDAKRSIFYGVLDDERDGRLRISLVTAANCVSYRRSKRPRINVLPTADRRLYRDPGADVPRR